MKNVENVEKLLEILKSTRYGEILIKLQDGEIVLIEKTERIKL